MCQALSKVPRRNTGPLIGSGVGGWWQIVLKVIRLHNDPKEDCREICLPLCEVIQSRCAHTPHPQEL